MGVAASSSRKYDVFLSFRGEDTRESFTSHLHAALCRRDIETYIDYKLPKGDDISQSLIEAIQDSSISVVVFSKNYATSKWCLNELVQIIRCKEHQAQIVVPIFYRVDPSHVRNQTEAYGEAFAQHLRKNPEKVEEWKKALSKTASLAGWDSCKHRDEEELILKIVNDVINKLNRGSSVSVSENIVGIDENLGHIESLLEESSTIGIWGMGGVGKTTMAKVVFAKLCSQFDSCCFLENFRENYKMRGLEYVRDKLFCELLKDTSLRRLNRRKVLIVLDDVSSTKQLDDLKRDAPLLRPGSKVIITSRDMRVLDGRVDKIHKAEALSNNNSLELFKLKAFCKDGYKSEYEELVKRALTYCKGNPLALTVLGSNLRSNTVEEWEDALSKIEKTPDQEIQPVLKLSYDELDDENKEIFLDIACFLKGESRECVIRTLKGCGFHVNNGLRTLVDKALVSIGGFHHAVLMHDLIQSMAIEIVRQENVRNPGERSRLWDPNEIYDVLKNNQGSDAIQGISLDLSQIKDLQLSADAFRNMTNLRLLKFYSPWDKRSCIVNLPSRFESFPNSLRCLLWDNFPLKSLPLSFCTEKLVELHMPNSRLQKLWDGVQNLVNLRNINLEGSQELMELPDLSTAERLECLYLDSCKSLCHLHPSILSLPRLRDLNLGECENLESLETESPSKSLSQLNVTGCRSLKKFSFSSDKLTSLELYHSPVENLDFSMGPMEQLRRLWLNGSRFQNLPFNEICCMRSLEVLYLDNCEGMIDKSKLQCLFDALRSLEFLSLRRSSTLTELPNNIKLLSRLQSLDVSGCKGLQSLPELPPSIKVLVAEYCTSLKTLQSPSQIESPLLADEKMLGSTLCSSSSVSYLQNLQELNLAYCIQLYVLPEFIGSLSSLSALIMEGSNIKSLPASIRYLSNLEEIWLIGCTRLRSLPELPPSIKTFRVDGCSSLEIVPISIPFSPQLECLNLGNCLKLENCFLSCVMESVYFTLKGLAYTKRCGDVCYPGRKVPAWLTSNQGTEASNCITIELFPSTTNNLIGFILCSVLSRPPHYGALECQFYYDGKKSNYSSVEFSLNENAESHHVFLWCDPNPRPFINFHKAIDTQNTNYRPKVSCEFFIDQYGKEFDDCTIEACGVCPICASEYRDFIQQMGREPNLGTQKESCHYADENSFHEMLQYVRFSLKQGKRGNFEESSIPEWFTYKSSTIGHEGLQVGVQLAPDFDNLIGFIFCFVIPRFSSKEMDQYKSSCKCNLRDRVDRVGLPLEGPNGWHYSMEKLNSDDNVFLWYDPLYCERILHEQRRKRKGYNKGLEFQFNFGDGKISGCYVFIRDCLIKECGVRPIYVSEYTNFLQQKKLEASMPKKRHRNIDDDQHQLPSTKKLKDSQIIQSNPNEF